MEALEYIHSKGVTHGNLTPSHIMWFADAFAWKVVDLEYASQESEVTLRHRAGRYASPEHVQAENRGRLALPLCPSADMWSFGVIAFEVLTSEPLARNLFARASALSGSSVVDSAAIQAYIDRKLGQAASTSDRSPQRWLSANRRGRTSDVTEEQTLRFVQTLLRSNPEDRRSATAALEDSLFRSATDVYQRMGSQRMVLQEALPLHTLVRRGCCPGGLGVRKTADR